MPATLVEMATSITGEQEAHMNLRIKKKKHNQKHMHVLNERVSTFVCYNTFVTLINAIYYFDISPETSVSQP